MAIDPVCGMQVDEASAPGKTQYEGVTYYFCSPACQDAFEDDPESFVSAA